MRGLACLLADRDDPFTGTLEVELSEVFSSVRVLARGEDVPPCALLLIDLDYAPSVLLGERRIGYARKEGKPPFPFLLRPFRIEELRALLPLSGDTAPLTPSPDYRTVTVAGETLALTEREAALLRLLYEANGEPIPRSALAAAVFPEADVPEDSLAVYICYLRKKLERDGTHRLLAHRGKGYSLLRD